MSIMTLLCKAFLHKRERCQVLGFINLVVDSDDKNDDIFEPKRSLSGACNTSVNHICVKKD